jgi:hypothetical protein
MMKYLLLLSMILAVAMAGLPNFNNSIYYENLATLIYASMTFGACWLGGHFTMFLGNDEGRFFYKCYDAFVAKAVFN